MNTDLALPICNKTDYESVDINNNLVIQWYSLIIYTMKYPRNINLRQDETSLCFKVTVVFHFLCHIMNDVKCKALNKYYGITAQHYGSGARV
jgi:hypothetical protein